MFKVVFWVYIKKIKPPLVILQSTGTDFAYFYPIKGSEKPEIYEKDFLYIGRCGGQGSGLD